AASPAAAAAAAASAAGHQDLPRRIGDPGNGRLPAAAPAPAAAAARTGTRLSQGANGQQQTRAAGKPAALPFGNARYQPPATQGAESRRHLAARIDANTEAKF